jgi:hypothetical protein
VIRSVLTLLAVIGFLASLVANALVLTGEIAAFPRWFAFPWVGVFVLGVPGILVCHRLATVEGITGSGAQWRYVSERCPKGFGRAYPILMGYAAVYFAIYFFGHIRDLAVVAQPPLGPFSASMMFAYYCLFAVFYGGMQSNSTRPAV